MDVCSAVDMDIGPGETAIVPTGLKVAIPVGYELQARPRSGLSLRTGLRMPNAPGTIDAGYRGELGIILSNTRVGVLCPANAGGAIGNDAAALLRAAESAGADDLLETERLAAEGEFPVRTLDDPPDETPGVPPAPCVYRIRKGDRIAQLVLKECPVVEFVEVASVAEIGVDRGGGYGSTGVVGGGSTGVAADDATAASTGAEPTDA